MDDAPYTIGQLAERSGLPVKTIRFYSDEGILPPSGRTTAGYRLYDEGDRARLELIRTLRDLGFDLPTIRSLLDRDLPADKAVDLQLRAVETQLRTLRVARAVLRRARARGAADAAHLGMLATLARLTVAERAQLVHDFWREATPHHDWARSMADASLPDLPDDPTDEQLDAWLELAELTVDADFLTSLRAGAASPGVAGGETRHWVEAGNEAAEAMDAGVTPENPGARPVVDRFLAREAAARARPADDALRAELLAAFDAHDPRAARWWELVAILQGWDTTPVAAAYDWLRAALSAHPVR